MSKSRLKYGIGKLCYNTPVGYRLFDPRFQILDQANIEKTFRIISN